MTPAQSASLLPVSIRDKAALHAAYMPFVTGAGLFVPTTRVLPMGAPVSLMLTLVDEPTRYAINSRVVWVTPPGSASRQQGVGLQFGDDEIGRAARLRIEQILGPLLSSSRPTHTL